MEKKLKPKLIILATIILLGMFFRLYGLSSNYSFWTDEAGSARYARFILNTGLPVTPWGYTEKTFYTNAYFTALSFRVLGQNEFAARFPQVIFGTLLIALVYYLAIKLFSRPAVGLAAVALTAFSYLQILYSRQARGYQLASVLYLSSLFYLINLFTGGKKLTFKKIGVLFFLFLLSIFTHPICLLPFLASVLWLSIKKPKMGLVLIVALPVLVLGFLGQQISLSNNLSFYHSFLWRQYAALLFPAFLGWLVSLKEYREKSLLIASMLLIHLVFFSFFFGQSFTRYLLPLFPIFYIYFAYFLSEFCRYWKIVPRLTMAALVFFFIANGNKFTLKPKVYYSLNFDMKEVPEVDYKAVYNFIQSKSGQNAVIVDTWGDVANWYLGEGKMNYFLKDPLFSVKAKENPNFNPANGGIIISSLDDLKEVIGKHAHGFVVIEDQQIPYAPPETVNWIKNNLDLEMRVDHLPLSPESIWPLELYSWGFPKNQ